MPAEVEVEPTHHYGQSAVSTHGDEEQGAVLEMRAVMGREQDGESGNGHGDGEEGEKEAVFGQVGEVGDDEGEDEGGGPGGHAVQLSADLGVAVRLDDAGGEEGVAVCGHEQPKVHEAAQEDFVVFEDVEDVFGGYLAFARGLALVFLEARFDVGALVFVEPRVLLVSEEGFGRGCALRWIVTIWLLRGIRGLESIVRMRLRRIRLLRVSSVSWY